MAQTAQKNGEEQVEIQSDKEEKTNGEYEQKLQWKETNTEDIELEDTSLHHSETIGRCQEEEEDHVKDVLEEWNGVEKFCLKKFFIALFSASLSFFDFFSDSLLGIKFLQEGLVFNFHPSAFGEFSGNYFGDFKGSGAFSGDLRGDFSGDFSGSGVFFSGYRLSDYRNLSGDFRGDFRGNFSGEFSGDFIGIFNGDFRGDCTALNVTTYNHSDYIESRQYNAGSYTCNNYNRMFGFATLAILFLPGIQWHAYLKTKYRLGRFFTSLFFPFFMVIFQVNLHMFQIPMMSGFE